MKLITLFLLLFSLTTSAQLAVIVDADGYTNVRADKNAQSKIVGRLVEGDVFTYDPTAKSEWVYISKDGTLKGYIHKSRLNPIDEWPRIPPTEECRTLKGNELTMANDTVKVIVKTAPFVAAKHVIKKDNNFVKTIDGVTPKGTDGELPKVQLASIEMFIKNKPVTIPASAYAGMFESGLKTCNVYFNMYGIIYLYMPANSDGAGFYSVVWVIKDGKYNKRYVDAFE